MRIGILGAGSIGAAFARRLVAGGHEALLSNSRGPETLGDLVAELGPGATAGTRLEAAQAEIVVLAVPRPQVAAALDGLPGWDGRILVDATNDFSVHPGPGEVTTSEQVAALAPGARVLKALNHLFAASLAADPHPAAGNRVLFVSGDDHEAKKQFSAVLSDLGYAPIDLGGLATGGRLHQANGGPLVGHDLVRLASA
ncbi:NADPH-dependent F420 reductase [Amycolatopsis lexingtonensis]|uniref:NADPH-dependent F420 reductase n=1 Tax=Amycolatopsis lexingtonensis TaxID=218822 RepID=UPI003F71AE26